MPYLSADHIKVSVSSIPAGFVWVNPSVIRLDFPAAQGAAVIIQRQTPLSPLVEFQPGAVLTETDLNIATRQSLYVMQEAQESLGELITDAKVRLGANLGIVTDPEDVLDELTQLALQNNLLLTFQTKIAEIEQNAQSIIAQSIQVGNLGSVQSLLQAQVSSAETSIANIITEVDSLVGVVDGLVDIGGGGGIATLIANESAQRVAGDTALATTLSLIGAVSGDNLSFILDQNKVRVSSTESLAQRLTAISASEADGRALALSQITAVSTTLSNEVTRIEGVIASSSLGDRNAAQALVTAETNARTAAITAESNARLTLASRVSTAEASLASEVLTRAAADTVLTQTLSLMGASVNGNTAFQFDLAKVLVAPGESLGTRLSSISVAQSNNAAAIINESNARATAIASEASQRASLASTVGTLSGTVQTEISTRTGLTDSLTTSMTLLGARSGDGTAFDLNLNTVRVSPTESLSTRLSGITASINNANAAIANEIIARANGDGTLAQSLSTIQTTLNGNTASITSIQSVVNGLNAKVGVSLNVNGHITGWVANNNGSQGTFRILADVFAIVDPGNGQPFVPFEVSDGVVRAPNLLVGNLIAGSVTTTSLTGNAVSDFQYAEPGGASSVGTSWQTYASVTMNPSVARGFYKADWSMGYQLFTNSQAEGDSIEVRIRVNGNVVYQAKAGGSPPAVSAVVYQGGTPWIGVDEIIVPGVAASSASGFDIIPVTATGTQTITLEFRMGVGISGTITDPRLAVAHFKA
jgi:hypothetical protein